MIRNIVFDMGNVLIRFDAEFFMDKNGIDDPADRALIRKELFRSVEWAQMDMGVLTEETAEPIFLPRFPERLKAPVLRMLNHWADDSEIIPGMEKLAEELKEAGYSLYLLSNASVRQHEYWPRFSVSALLDGKMISCDEGVVKPDPVIYRRFTERFGLRPEECLFVDDQPINVAEAIRSGWAGAVFHGDAGELKKKLVSRGVRIKS